MADQPAPAPANDEALTEVPPTAVSAPPESSSSSRVPRWALALVAAVTLLTTAAGVTLSVAVVSALQDLPRTVVAQYLGELQHGRAEAAMKLAGIRANSEDVLLNDAAYAKITDRISGFTVEPAVTRGSKTTVGATISQGDRTYQRSFAVERSGGLPWLPFWRLAHVQPDTVDLTVSGPAGIAFAVGGARPASVPIGTAVALRALPGTYPVTFTSPSSGFEVWDAEVTSTPAGGFLSPTEFTARLSSAGDTAGRTAIDAWLDACVASSVADPHGCPFYTFSQEPGVTITDVRWSLGARPTVTLSPVWTAGGWAVFAADGSVSGQADLVRASDGATGAATVDSIPVAFVGVLTFDGDGPRFVPIYSDGGAQDGSGA